MKENTEKKEKTGKRKKREQENKKVKAETKHRIYYKTGRKPNRRPDRMQILKIVTVITVLTLMAAVIFLATYLRLCDNIISPGQMPPEQAIPEGAGKPLSNSSIALICGTSAISLTVIFGLYILIDDKKLFDNPKLLFITASLIITAAALTALTTLITYTFTAVLLAVILVGILIDKKSAYATVLMTSAVAGLTAFSIGGTEQLEAVSVTIAMITGGIFSVFALDIIRHTRIIPILSGIAGGAAATVAYMCVQAFLRVRLPEMITNSLWLFACSVLCGITATGLMPIFEALFDIATDARLNELTNNSNPLLKRLMVEAPGTYYHSLLVANLAESAAEKIGANPLLCKAAGYYHDVGKLRSPMHFRENQRDYNVHDGLEPEESAARIIAHLSDGVTLLTKYKLPSDIVRISAEHHGDSLVYFFYNKAIRKMGSVDAVDQEKFRYHAPRPSSKESAIVLLADCCEAAVRSVQHPTPQLIEEKIKDVIGNIWLRRDGVLSKAPITAKDVSEIEAIFIKTLSAQYHERIEYPDLETVTDEKNE